jgi:AcrR family transcriptional regulator
LSPEQKSTSNILLETAGKIFAKKGFAGTSIRDIATTANVNIAAVNYHFKTKENLYAEVFRYNWNKLDENIKKLAKKFEKSSLHQLSYEMFQLFEASETALANSFKVILTDEITLPSDFHFDQSVEQFGPPGGAALLEHVTRTIGDDVDLEIRAWVVEVIFTHIAHIALISSATSLKNLKEISQVCNASAQKNSIYHLVESTLFYAKNNKKSWNQLNSMS